MTKVHFSFAKVVIILQLQNKEGAYPIEFP